MRARHPFAVDVAVVLPDHLHAIWTMRDGDADFATRWRLIKSGFSHGLPGGERISASRAAKAERGIWQRRYWEHALREEDDFARHLDYIHFNPVKHGHADRVRDWPFFSFRCWVRLGAYPVDWAGNPGGEALIRRKVTRFAAFNPSYALRTTRAKFARSERSPMDTTSKSNRGLV